MWSTYAVIVLLATAHSALAEGTVAAEAPTEEAPAPAAAPKCPVVTAQHYEAKNCAPVMEAATEACPTSYDCESGPQYTPQQCVYRSTVYALGQTVPMAGPCRRGCYCRRAVDPMQPAEIVCAIEECPSSIRPPKPGCRQLYNIDDCCEVEEECSEVVAAAEVTEAVTQGDCVVEGFHYFLGDKIRFNDAPCQYCVCTKDYTGPYGTNCTTLDCGIAYKSTQYLRTGCTPLYLDGYCCNNDWICPGSAQIIHDSDLFAKGDETSSTHCTIGDVVAPIGTQLKTFDCIVNCICSTPPDFTCISYSSCQQALAAAKANYNF